jgi:hypothetical protein
LDFKFRFIGTDLVPGLKHDWTGKWMSEMEFQAPGTPIWECHERVVKTAAPSFIEVGYVGPDPDITSVECLILPLGRDHLTVDMLMIFVDMLRRSEA